MKNRRIILATEMFSLLESTDDELHQADEILVPVARAVMDGLLPAGTFCDLVKAGKLQSATVATNEKPVCVLFFSLNGLNWLTIEGTAALATSKLSLIFAAVEALAEKFGSPMKVFVTKFSAIFYKGLKEGYVNGGAILMQRRENASPV